MCSTCPQVSAVNYAFRFMPAGPNGEQGFSLQREPATWHPLAAMKQGSVPSGWGVLHENGKGISARIMSYDVGVTSVTFSILHQGSHTVVNSIHPVVRELSL